MLLLSEIILADLLCRKESNQPVDTLLALQVLHPCCHVFCHFHQHLLPQIVTLITQEGEKIPTFEKIGQHKE